ncbi:hypothetical protein FRC10_001045 [Ceratobasidium sp. 414]|nr:hypothetical protein FRC10_001045 [Ceratobasidium sp. 414]
MDPYKSPKHLPQGTFLVPRSTESQAMHILQVIAVLGSLVVMLAVGAPTAAPDAAVKVLVGNDDGWAEANVRAFYQTLSAAGYNTILSAPVQDQSGTGSSDAVPRPLTKPGQYNSVPAGAPAQGANATDPRLNYVNSYPVTAIKYGISTVAPKFFGGPPNMVVAGPNLGNNLGIVVSISGTVGAAAEAAKQGLPAIAFSAESGNRRSYTTLQAGDSSFVYAQVSQKLVAALTATAEPWMPKGVGLVGTPSEFYGPATELAISSTCAGVDDFQFVLTRIYWSTHNTDVVTCNNGGRLPNEVSVFFQPGKCYVTVSVFDARDKTDVGIEQQASQTQIHR